MPYCTRTNSFPVLFHSAPRHSGKPRSEKWFSYAWGVRRPGELEDRRGRAVQAAKPSCQSNLRFSTSEQRYKEEQARHWSGQRQCFLPGETRKMSGYSGFSIVQLRSIYLLEVGTQKWRKEKRSSASVQLPIHRGSASRLSKSESGNQCPA